MYMKKEEYVKLIGMSFLVLFLLFLSLGRKAYFYEEVFSESKEAEVKVEELIEKNKDMELIVNKNYDQKFIYLAFQKETKFVSYILNPKNGKEVDFDSCLKDGKKEEFLEKVTELLHLKYPSFLVEILLDEKTTKNYQILENELIIHYDVSATLTEAKEEFYLRVNYNEIKDYLDFTFLLDSTYENENGYHYDKNKKAIAFTFDDGPNGARTNKIVEALEQNKAHATFFMVGNRMQAGETVIRNVLAKGNEIGSHSYAHKNMKRQTIEDIIASEEQTNSIYRSITGQDLIYMRPPYGSINKDVKESLNTIFVNWNLDTEDWLHRDKNYIIDYVMHNVSDGDIVLMHDSYDSTVEAVLELLPKLYLEGYQVVSVSELAHLKGVSLENHQLYRSLKKV